MSTSAQSVLNDFRAFLKKIKAYEEAIGLMYWDLRTGAPKKSVEGRSETIGELSGEMFRMSVSERMGEYLNTLGEPETFAGLSEVDRKIVQVSRKEYDRSVKIPPEMYQAYVVLTSKAESVWEEAKHASDFPMFRPYLEQIVKTNLEFIDLWGYEGEKYNTLLDMYEPEMTVDALDRLFGRLRERLVPLVEAISETAQPDITFLDQTFAKEKQQSFGLFILEQMGFDFAAGRLDETVHPFATGLNLGDVRITTRYLERDVVSALFGIIHEGGHALYEQNISPDLAGTPLCTGTSMGIHESQSRFWENVIGRSRPFWSRYFVDLQRTFPGQFNGVAPENFYRAINRVEPSLIRIEADELTYNLHIMIRYELEKALFNGSLQVADLPAAWNEKYNEYLGVRPEQDSVGVLQDVHWSGGSFGYFPSYSLGNMYAAQFTHTMRRELPEMEADVAAGRLLPIKQWLCDKIYRYGKLRDPGELVREITGESLNPDYLVDYLEVKYKNIYRLS
ncbi:MAG: peptidase [Paenibacillaceae bacterium]|jgi:carboxypeptidase Taq|nr:peptidase [Paenibacillaceae bacterium]